MLLIKKLSAFFKAQMEFTQKETNAFIVLVVICAFFVFSPLALTSFLAAPLNINDDEAYLKKIEAIIKNDEVVRQTTLHASSKEYCPSSGGIKAQGAHIQEVVLFDINKADTIRLKKLRGIGSVFANRIVKYRELLGGYHSLHQLNEVYRLSPKAIQTLKGSVDTISLIPYRFLSIETANFKELLRHPYLNYRSVKAIMKMRESTSPITSALLKTVIDNDSYQKILPYIEF